MSDDPVTWQFALGDPALVAHLPMRHGGYAAYRLDDTEAHAVLTPRQRGFVRALLSEATRLLDESEPANPNGAGR